MNILFKYPSRQRPQLFKFVVDKYFSMLSKKHSYQFIVTADSDDESMNNSAMIDFMNSRGLKYFFGENKSKVQAINANLQGAQFDIIILISDDMIPTVHGFDDVIAKTMQSKFPDMDGALHFNDGVTGQNLLTLSILGYNLYRTLGYLYHPDYVSLWCDNEFMQVVKKMGKYVYLPTQIIKHQWMKINANGQIHGQDKLYSRNNAFYGVDHQMYLLRKSKGFPQNSVKAQFKYVAPKPVSITPASSAQVISHSISASPVALQVRSAPVPLTRVQEIQQQKKRRIEQIRKLSILKRTAMALQIKNRADLLKDQKRNKLKDIK